MSVRLNGDLPGSVSSDQSTDYKSTKKRKHESTDQQISKKKRKQKDATDREASTGDTADLLTTEKKEHKKKKDKSKESTGELPDVQEATVTDEDIELPDAPVEDVAEPTPIDEITEDALPASVEYVINPDLLDSADPSCFYSTRISLSIPIPAIALSTATASILSAHLAPLLLTYFPPAKGIVLAFSDPVLSAKPDTNINRPLLLPRDGSLVISGSKDTLARTAHEFGVSWVWLTTTVLVFRPEGNNELEGWVNVTSENFVGLVSYNYFQTAVDRKRIPAEYKWNGPHQEYQRKRGKKGRLRDEDGSVLARMESVSESNEFEMESGNIADDVGYFANQEGLKLPEVLSFRVVDTEMVSIHGKGQWSLQIEGTLLDEEAEAKVLEGERASFDWRSPRSRSRTPGLDQMMSGAIARSREASVVSRVSGRSPAVRHRSQEI